MSSAASPGTVSIMEGKLSWIEMLMWESTCVFGCFYLAVDKAAARDAYLPGGELRVSGMRLI